MAGKTKSEKIIEELFVLARDHEKFGRARVAAAVVHRGKIISYGFNQPRTHSLQQVFQKNPEAIYLHAEIDAIKNAIRVSDYDTLKKSTVYVARSKNVDGDDVYGNAKPCKGCEACLKFFNVKRVIYTTDEGFEVEEV